jgi:hypothetical protein
LQFTAYWSFEFLDRTRLQLFTMLMLCPTVNSSCPAEIGGLWRLQLPTFALFPHWRSFLTPRDYHRHRVAGSNQSIPPQVSRIRLPESLSSDESSFRRAINFQYGVKSVLQKCQRHSYLAEGIQHLE